MKTLAAWLQASRLPSQSYIFFGLLAGQMLAKPVYGFSWTLFTVCLLHGLFLQLYIVYANDYADRAVDPLNTTYNLFSGGSRVLVEQLLQPVHLLRAAVVTAGLGYLLAAIVLLSHGRPLFAPLVLTSHGLLWLYSYRPARLSYRGGGELLQMLGVGLVLPVTGYYVQAGTVGQFPWPVLFIILPAQLACAMSTALPDEPGDREGGKRTSAVLLGPPAAKTAIMLLHAAALVAFGILRTTVTDLPAYVSAAPLLLLSGMLLMRGRARPGTPGMTAWVSLSIAFTLMLMGLLAAGQ